MCSTRGLPSVGLFLSKRVYLPRRLQGSLRRNAGVAAVGAGSPPEGQPLRAQLPAPTCVRGRALGPRSPRRRLPGRQQQRQQQQRPRHPPPPSPLGSRSHLGGAGAALSAGRKEAAGVGAPDGHVRAGTGPPPAPRGVPAPGSLRALPLRRSREPLTGPPAPSACPGASS